MSAASELKALVKQLQHSSTEQEIIGILQTLKREAKITEAVLRESKAGLAVGKLRTHSAKSVSDLAKEIVKKWKNEVEKEKQHAKGPGGPAAAPASKPPGKPVHVLVSCDLLILLLLRRQSSVPRRTSTLNAGSASPSTPTTPSMSASSSKSDLRTSRSDGIKINVTGDNTRDKCIELLYDALAFDSGAPSEQLLTRAKAIESAVLQDNGNTSAAYKSKIRSLYVNLKDKNNPTLRESVVSGDLPVARFCKMTSQEMASEERKAADNKIKQDNLFKTLGAEEVQAETDAFQCGRCKQRKCRYRQAQTRSADEPMTTFVTCTYCNNRWKFS
ncbi:hypothetical protein NLI96_g4494 [Meripilus lineatus]|uniref:Transcription elongation factor n=1 Tax=Meripilus lineatus TaxID=2056292 RepID=A0AAD5V4V8_9APHY|nr:hypothetical protein NLI96_g4494 [Physisporinus lineatus]